MFSPAIEVRIRLPSLSADAETPGTVFALMVDATSFTSDAPVKSTVLPLILTSSVPSPRFAVVVVVAAKFKSVLPCWYVDREVKRVTGLIRGQSDRTVSGSGRRHL